MPPPTGEAVGGVDPSPSPFPVEPVLADCRRDVVALAEWAGPMPSAETGPPPAPRLYVGLDDGTLLVLRREEEESTHGDDEEGRRRPGSAPSTSTSTATSTHPPGAVVSSASAASLGEVAPPWRVVAAYTHVARKGVKQMQV